MKRSWSVLLIVLIVVVGGAGWLAVRGGLFGRARANVILISLDTCRPDYLSCYGRYANITPNIDALAADATLFSNVISSVPLTLPSHSSIMTGNIPPRHGVHDNINYRLSDANVTLAERLGEHGYQTGAVIGAFVLDSQFGLAQGFDIYEDELGDQLTFMGGYAERPGGEVTRLAGEWLDGKEDGPFFLFLHYFDPHHPYAPPLPYSSVFADNPYMGEVAFTDHCVGQVIDKLKSLDLYESSMIVIVGDHGESLWEHGESKHGYFIYHSTTKVPLIIKPPGGQRSRTIQETVATIDILPTILAQLDLPATDDIGGVDLSPLMNGQILEGQERFFYSESMTPTRYGWNSLLAIESQRWKYIQTTRPELYDLEQDPGEANNLLETAPRQAARFREELRQMLEDSLAGAAQDAGLELTLEARRKLSGIGYTGGPVDEVFEFDSSRQDPKGFIEVFTKIESLDYNVDAGNFDEARTVATEILAQQPDIAHVHSKLGEVALKQRDFDEALIHYTKAIELDPSSAEWHVNLGILLSQRDRFDEAISHFQEAIRLLGSDDGTDNVVDQNLAGISHQEPVLSRAYFSWGNTLMQRSELNEAVEKFRKAIQLDPQTANLHFRLGEALKKLGQIDDAVDSYRETLRLDPEHQRARRALDNAANTASDPAIP